MLIDRNILITYGGVSRKIRKGECIFFEGDLPIFYYQIIEGEVRLYSTNEDGKIIIQGLFDVGQSFGEPPLLINKPYPSTAEAINDCIVMRLRKESLLNILKDFPEIERKLLYAFAERIYYKATTAQIWLAHKPEEKIMLVLERLKEKDKINNEKPIPYTRKQIANLTGLRTETVIRTLNRMNTEGKIQIKKHKLYFN